jgi:hypothetical protein
LPAIVKFLWPQRAAAGRKQAGPSESTGLVTFILCSIRDLAKAKLTISEFLDFVHSIPKVHASETGSVSVLRLKLGKCLLSSPTESYSRSPDLEKYVSATGSVSVLRSKSERAQTANLNHHISFRMLDDWHVVHKLCFPKCNMPSPKQHQYLQDGWS